MLQQTRKKLIYLIVWILMQILFLFYKMMSRLKENIWRTFKSFLTNLFPSEFCINQTLILLYRFKSFQLRNEQTKQNWKYNLAMWPQTRPGCGCFYAFLSPRVEVLYIMGPLHHLYTYYSIKIMHVISLFPFSRGMTLINPIPANSKLDLPGNFPEV